jgi:hypothetical protein
MGMIAYALRVSEKELDNFLKDSSLLEARIDEEQVGGLNDLLDLDKSWEAIFYILTGHPFSEIEEAHPPLSWVLFNGQVVDESQDLGYGPASYITINQVKELNTELDKITRNDVELKYDGKRMDEARVYPEVWEQEQSLDYVIDYFGQLKDFYKKAESEGKAVITFLS